MAAAGISLCLIGGLAAATPFARLPIRNTEGILPAYAAATLVLEIVTAALLLALYTVQRSHAVLILACGYLFSALMIPAWVLTFPGAFSALGVEPSLQTTAAVAAVRRLGFPLFVLGYALAPIATRSRSPAAGAMVRAVLAVCAAAGLMLWLIFAHAEDLPPLMRDERNADRLWRYVPMAALAIYALDISVLLFRRRTPLDIWVSVVVVSLVIELVLISYLGGAVRLGVGWWAGRLYGLAAASIVLFVLLYEVAGVYARLARTLAAERRVRQNRLIAMEALSASIAHEINQPLASMVTNADAALRWLSKDPPRLDRADDALRRIVADGHRANKVVAGIRTMFMKGTQERAELDLNALARDAARAAAAEARFDGVLLETDLAPGLPRIIGNAVQLHQMLCNLLENAIDAVTATPPRQRQVALRTRTAAFGEVELTVADNGAGIDPSVQDRLFDPFVSTKPGGMGMGLMFCRAVAEAHGGRLWAEPNVPRGAVFRLALPAASDPTRGTEVEP